ncbi:hypothetical protein [Pirellula sp. SH-Sr6A]|uniref:hypothetical protein n=1 Tax=Pirellula sp. SH-Sr6A TaxID=1632865 RepID=UPI0011BA9A03|nr:hypothetical protein [Pirellula sp. SH-Sr6A]
MPSARPTLPYAVLESPAGCLGEILILRDALGDPDLLRTTDQQCRTARPRPFLRRVPPYYRPSHVSLTLTWQVPQAVWESFLTGVMR